MHHRWIGEIGGLGLDLYTSVYRFSFLMLYIGAGEKGTPAIFELTWCDFKLDWNLSTDLKTN